MVIARKLSAYLEERSTLYISRETSIDLKSDFILVQNSSDHNKKFVCKYNQLRRIVFLGLNRVVPSSALYMLERKGIIVDFLDHKSLPLAQLLPFSGKSIRPMYSLQEKIINRNAQLELSKILIYSKINNTFKLISRKLEKKSNNIQKYKILIKTAQKIEQLRGIEGYCAKDYFSKWNLLIKGLFPWRGRQYHPALDPVNIMLSIGYNLLTMRMYSSVIAYGLNPRLGLFHSGRDNHFALSSDLIEPFRAFIDNTVLNLIRRRQIKLEHFKCSSGGRYSFAEPKAYKVLIESLEETFSSEYDLTGLSKTTPQIKSLNNHIDDLAYAFYSFLNDNYNMTRMRATSLIR